MTARLQVGTGTGWETVPGIAHIQASGRSAPPRAVRAVWLFGRDYWWDRLPDGRLTLRPLHPKEAS